MKHIHVIDDDELVRRLLRSALEEAGYRVTEASNGNTAVAFYREDPADVVILDVLMPERDGIETIGDLASHFPDVKIITISKGIKGEKKAFLECAKNLGALRTFEKPLDIMQVLDTVRDILRDHESNGDEAKPPELG